jgi:hypothetical protein
MTSIMHARRPVLKEESMIRTYGTLGRDLVSMENAEHTTWMS